MHTFSFFSGFISGVFLGSIVVWLFLSVFSEDQKEERGGEQKKGPASKQENSKKEINKKINKKEDKEEKKKPKKRIESKEEEDDSNLENFNDKRQTKVEKRKEKIINRIKKKDEIQTGDVMDMFKVSRVTAFRYLDDLEKEGVIKQAGKAGRSVRYKLNV
ncbi:MAG: DeoR family transcriptional regulator [Patescibacteria group bacterium]